MLFRIFSLHPEIFDSFKSSGLVARGIKNDIIKIEPYNWRQDFGVGNYKQIDDRPFGGGSGMVLQPDPIFKALQKFDAVSTLFKKPTKEIEHKKLEPNNSNFFKLVKSLKNNPTKNITKATISLTPRGFAINQQIVEWLANNFEELNILCGRYEGFDARVSEAVDLELSVGDFVLNGGEVAAMSLVEAVSRLVPGFIAKQTSVMHDSFSSGLNEYKEQSEFVIGKNKLKECKRIDLLDDVLDEDIFAKSTENLFDNQKWISQTLPQIEHPQYTRPETWNNWQAPALLKEGNHKLIQNWRRKWW